MFTTAVVVAVIVGNITLPVCLCAVVIHWEVRLEIEIAVRIIVGKSKWNLRIISLILTRARGFRSGYSKSQANLRRAGNCLGEEDSKIRLTWESVCLGL